MHFISPSVWAWRAERIKKVHLAVDLMLCVFPFEPALYAKHGVAATYVGHPLADAIPLEVPRAQARAALRIAPGETLIALLPGSRKSEIQYVAPRIFAAAQLMHRERPALRFVLPVVPGLRHAIEPLRRQHANEVPIELLDARSHEALAACDVALVASGTATLETALFKRPMVICYAMHALSWQLMKRMKLQPWVGLPNILLHETVVPELIQAHATPEKLAQATLAWLDDPARVDALVKRFHTLHVQLRRNTAQAATDAIEALLAQAAA